MEGLIGATLVSSLDDDLILQTRVIPLSPEQWEKLPGGGADLKVE